MRKYPIYLKCRRTQWSQVLNDIPVDWTTDDDVLNTVHAYFIEKIDSTDFVLGNVKTVDVSDIKYIIEDFFYANGYSFLQKKSTSFDPWVNSMSTHFH